MKWTGHWLMWNVNCCGKQVNPSSEQKRVYSLMSPSIKTGNTPFRCPAYSESLQVKHSKGSEIITTPAELLSCENISFFGDVTWKTLSTWIGRIYYKSHSNYWEVHVELQWGGGVGKLKLSPTLPISTSCSPSQFPRTPLNITFLYTLHSVMLWPI